MKYHKGRGDGNSLMQVAAAVVGSAAASQVIPTGRNAPHPYESACDETCNNGPSGPGTDEPGERVGDAAGGLLADDPYPDPGCPKRTGNASNFCLLEEGHEGPCDDQPNPDLLRQITRLKARIAELEQAAPAGALDVHAALNTYEVMADVEPAAEQITPSMLLVVGQNHRRLVVRWLPEGVWVGGCLIADREHAERLAAFITREGEG